MTKLQESVYQGLIEVGGETFKLGSKRWFAWLDRPETRSFRYGDGGGFTCRKESVKGTDGYWYAYRKVAGKLHKRYIGKSVEMTLQKLSEIDEALDTPTVPRKKKESELHSQLGNQIELELHNELGNLRTENDKLKAELIEVRSQLNYLEQVNDSFGQQAQILQEDLIELRSQLCIQSDPDSHAEIVALRKELKAEIQRFKQTENSLRGNDDQWQSRLTQVKTELAEAEAKLLKQNDTTRKLERELSEVRSQLTEAKKLDTTWQHKLLVAQKEEAEKKQASANADLVKLLADRDQLKKELAEVRSQLCTHPPIQSAELPDPATLLNQLKAKRKKSAVTLADVEAILEMIEESSPEGK